MEEVIIAVISGLCVAVPSVLATISAEFLHCCYGLEYKIDELDKKVHEHNNLIDRMYKVENRVTLLEEKGR